MGIWYATVEQVRQSLEIAETSRSTALIASKLELASRSVESQMNRRFYPERKTVTFDWPNYQHTSPWTQWLGDNELISAATVTSGGVVIPANNYFLRRSDDKDEPPYTFIEINLASSSAFAAGTTFQRALSILGLYGWNDTSTAVTQGTLSAGINSAVTTLVIDPASGVYDPGIGALILIGTERMILTSRRMSDTGQNLQGTMSAVQSDQIVDVTNGAAFAVDEVILIDAERMRISDIAANNLIVERAYDGSALSAHSASTDVFARRTFTAQRGVLGSTAASHSTNDPVYVHQFPVNELARAETIVMLEQDAAAWARVVGVGGNARESAGQGLADLRAQCLQTFGRLNRSTAI